MVVGTEAAGAADTVGGMATATGMADMEAGTVTEAFMVEAMAGFMAVVGSVEEDFTGVAAAGVFTEVVAADFIIDLWLAMPVRALGGSPWLRVVSFWEVLAGGMGYISLAT